MWNLGEKKNRSFLSKVALSFELMRLELPGVNTDKYNEIKDTSKTDWEKKPPHFLDLYPQR